VSDTRIGSGAGFAGDRIEPAVELVERGGLDDLVLECLAERTIALGQARRRLDPDAGFDPLLERRMRALLPGAVHRGVRLVSNMGAANPLAAGRRAQQVATQLGLDARVAVVTGDDVLDVLDTGQPALEDGRPIEERGQLLSANAYLGAEAVLPALDAGADVVLSGRVADPSLFLAVLCHRLGWALDDWPRLAAGTMVGHLLECAGQVTGGYFADPGRKDVPGLAHLGFPYADVTSEGTATLGKLSGTGGAITSATVREQLLYEITDPAAYLTPDVRLDLRQTSVRDHGDDTVTVTGAVGGRRPERLKVSVGYHAGYRAEGEISYVGPGAEARARLAADIVDERLRHSGVELRLDLIGNLDPRRTTDDADQECRLRVAGIGDSRAADDICHEVEALYTNGPAGGGGVRANVVEVVGIVSGLIDRDAVAPTVTFVDPAPGGSREIA
jgi:hypothetical protein